MRGLVLLLLAALEGARANDNSTGCDWPASVDGSLYSGSMSFVAVVMSGGAAVGGTLAAYKNGELRGVVDSSLAPFGPYSGQPHFQLTVFGDSSDALSEITFK